MSEMQTIEGGAPLTLEFVNQNASVLRWDFLAATMLDDDHHDHYLEMIDGPRQTYAAALRDAQLDFYSLNRTRGATATVGIRKRMRFHRARLQSEKAQAFAIVYSQFLKARAAS